MATTINCTNCNAQIEITEALKKQLEHQVLQDVQERHKKELALKDKEMHNRILLIQKEEKQKALDKAKADFSVAIKSAQDEAVENKQKNQKLQEELTELMKQLRQAKSAEENLNLRILEKEKKLNDAQKQIKELQRKIEQGSQQLQGEVQELQLEELLRSTFIFDEIKEVPKGIRGADIIQIVKTRSGIVCGTILWEVKNTKNWTQSWVQKLKEDQQALKAEIAIITSKVLPDGIESFGNKDDIWVTEISYSINLAFVLRQQLIGIQHIKNATSGRETKAEVVYNYLISNEFKQRIEVLVDYFRTRQEEINKERMYYTKKWEKEEKNILKVFQNTAGMYGELQGLIGTSLPKINYLEID